MKAAPRMRSETEPRWAWPQAARVMAPIEWPATIGSSPFDRGCLEDELKVRRERLERVVAVARSLGEAVAAVVVGDDAELVREPLDLAVPELRGLDPAVDEDEGGQVVRAVDAHVAVAAVGAADADGPPRLGLGAPGLARARRRACAFQRALSAAAPASPAATSASFRVGFLIRSEYCACARRPS